MDNKNFQTPKWVCDEVIEILDIPKSAIILEPTPGSGNFVSSLLLSGYNNTVFYINEDFFEIEPTLFDYIIGNPPFTPMTLGYEILERCFDEFLADNGTIAFILPYHFIINADRRCEKYKDYLYEVYHLPRRIFKGSRIQSAVFILKKKKRIGNIIWDLDTFLK